MEQRRPTPWGWIIAFVALLIVVAVVAYWFGAAQVHHLVAFRMSPRFGFGIVGLFIPVLIVALLIGLAVAAIVPSSRRSESFEEWHRRAHGADAPEHPAAPPPATPTTATAGDVTTTDESGPAGRGT